MDPIEVALGAAVGLAFQELYAKIRQSNPRSSAIKSHLSSLETKVDVLSRKFLHMEKLCPEAEAFTFKEQTSKLRSLLEKASVLVLACSRLRWWDLRKKSACAKRLAELDASFKELLEVDVQAAQLDCLAALAANMVEMNAKLDAMYAERGAWSDEDRGGGDEGLKPLA